MFNNRLDLRLFLIFMCCFLLSSCYKKNIVNDNYQLIWEENFNSNHLDSTIWDYMKRGIDPSRKYHSDDPQCYELKNGYLIIKGIKNTDLLRDTAKYLTGGITTQNKKYFESGKLEIRAKLNGAKGAWPAFWMLPKLRYKRWPSGGEIDIMEHLNYDDYVYQTVHSPFTQKNRNTKPNRYVKSTINLEEFNTYGVEFLPEYIKFYVNGNLTMSYPNLNLPDSIEQYPFNHEWYLMLDMQLGGSWVGPIDPNDLPVDMEIDWVKYYKKK